MKIEKQFDDFTWVDIHRSQDVNLHVITGEYNLNSFQIADSQERGHLPKLEKGSNYDFLILRAFTGNNGIRITNIEELSSKVAFFYNDKKLITIHREHFDFLTELQQQKFADVEELMLSIIYKMVETYLPSSYALSYKVDEFEKVIFLKNSTRISLEELYFHKSETRITKKLLLIMQNLIHSLEVKEKNKPALQNIKDTMLDLLLRYDEVMEDSHNLLNTYLSVNSQKSNDVMKLLTIFSAFFLPLTFIAGIYGMNFENMPELKWEAGYFLTLIVMVIVSLIIYIWFKNRNILK
jgi:Mg2+ and Co2+ transporters